MQSNLSTAERLTLSKGRVLAQWELQVRDEMHLKEHDTAQLRNSLPELLDVLVAVLTEPTSQEALDKREKVLAAGHGKVRAEDPAYSLDKVISEYYILQQALFDALEDGGETLSRRDRSLISNTIIRCIRSAACAFEVTQDRHKEALQQTVSNVQGDLEEALQRKSSEARLKDQLLKTIFERVEDYAIFSLNARGEVASWSDGCEKIKGYKANEVMGKHYSMLYPPEGRLRNDPEVHLEIAERLGRFRGEGLRMRKNGDLFLADVFITPMYEAASW